MFISCIRGAITVEQNTKEDILNSTEELIKKIIELNKLNIEDIVSILFTSTIDLNEAYPAVAARNIGITNASLMCVQEMYVKNSLNMCIRLMIQIQSELSQKDLKHVYLKKASILRQDLKQEDIK